MILILISQQIFIFQADFIKKMCGLKKQNESRSCKVGQKENNLL